MTVIRILILKLFLCVVQFSIQFSFVENKLIFSCVQHIHRILRYSVWRICILRINAHDRSDQLRQQLNSFLRNRVPILFCGFLSPRKNFFTTNEPIFPWTKNGFRYLLHLVVISRLSLVFLSLFLSHKKRILVRFCDHEHN